MKNGNHNWLEAEKLELSQLDEYKTFICKGKNITTLDSYNKIKVHFAYDVKHDGRH